MNLSRYMNLERCLRIACIVSFVFYNRPLGTKKHEQRRLRIQGRMQFFKKMSQNALNLDLTLPKDRRGHEISKSSGFFGLGALCVELRPFYGSKRILVPMSDISFWELHKLQAQVNPQGLWG